MGSKFSSKVGGALAILLPRLDEAIKVLTVEEQLPQLAVVGERDANPREHAASSFAFRIAVANWLACDPRFTAKPLSVAFHGASGVARLHTRMSMMRVPS